MRVMSKMPLIMRPDHDSGDGFWLVYCKDRERSIGRIYRQTAPNGSEEEWFWDVGFPTR